MDWSLAAEVRRANLDLDAAREAFSRRKRLTETAILQLVA